MFEQEPQTIELQNTVTLSGNTDKDSLGRIIVGYNDKKGWVSRPTEALNKLMEAIEGYAELKVIIK